MFVNKLNQVYKADRLLYYEEIGGDQIADFCNGEIESKADKYSDYFGTYDFPGVFFINKLNTPVIGIEFRARDERVDYPQDMKSVKLPEAFFYTVEIENDGKITFSYMRELIEKIASDNDAKRLYSSLSIKPEPDVVGIFSSEQGKKIRILYECEITKDIAREVIHDDPTIFDKKFLFNMAYYDPITRHYSWNHLEPFLEMPQDRGIQDYAFAHFDVKAFKVLNEVYGHITANNVLKRVVKALNRADFVYTSARCHNDNFAVMLHDLPEEELRAKLSDLFDSVSTLDEDPNYKIYYRCGVVPMKRSMLSGNRVADAAKLAQNMGTNRSKTDIVFYTDRMHDDIMWSNYIKAYLDTAVMNDEFVVYLQPKFDIYTEKIRGSEALVRWNYKKKELLSPYRFIPFFETDGSIAKVDDIVLKKVCESLARWKEEGKPLYPISVNLSRNQLYDPDIIGHLTYIVDSYKVDHSLIDFELTESATYDNKDRMLHVLHELRDRGFKVSMDDFGTGYSSFSLLTEMPLDTLKIDKSFVDKIGMGEERKQDTIVVRHIITLAKELGFVCLAEGAEEKSQIERLRELGCELVQGYYYSRPIPMEEYEEKYLPTS
ncbi:MAG: GGDEF domain-containing protein [Lachnospiraceae bacterium]|nr:GGDEF domain-containing protein [Lachnospiraceae bacterium]